MILPSKELLSRVLKKTVYEIDLEDYNEIFYMCSESASFNKINIFELTHLMKEWAFQKYDITIWTSRRQAKLNITGIWDEMPRFVSDEDDSTDISCVTKACEWILEQQ